MRASLAKKKIESKAKLADEKKREQVVELYRTRLSHLKRAQLFVKEDKMALAVDSYNKYLGILALFFDTTEDKLSPSLFHAEKDMTELLLISHAYWDLAKAYDRSPNLQRDCLRCLEQFIKFSIGFKYQHVNAQIIRKFNNKKQAHNPKAFETAYQRIQISSKRCYIATMVYGENHPQTHALRLFKKKISTSHLGLDFIDNYYRFSPLVVTFLAKHSFLRKYSTRIFIKPLLNLFIFCIRPYVQNTNTHR